MCSSSIARHCDVQQNDLYYEGTFQVTAMGKTGLVGFPFCLVQIFSYPLISCTIKTADDEIKSD